MKDTTELMILNAPSGCVRKHSCHAIARDVSFVEIISLVRTAHPKQCHLERDLIPLPPEVLQHQLLEVFCPDPLPLNHHVRRPRPQQEDTTAMMLNSSVIMWHIPTNQKIYSPTLVIVVFVKKREESASQPVW